MILIFGILIVLGFFAFVWYECEAEVRIDRSKEIKTLDLRRWRR